MEKSIFHYQPAPLTAEQALSGELRIVAAADSLSLLALSREKEVLALQAWGLAEKKPENTLYESELPELVSGLDILKLPFSEKKCAISSGMVTLVPNRLFHEAELNKYFQLLGPAPENAVYFSEAMQESGFYVVWVEEPHFQPLNKLVAPRHLAPVLIRAFQGLAHPHEKSIFIHVRGKQVQVLVFDAGILLYFNSFDFTKPADLLYYVLLGYDQFRLNPDKDPLQVSGALLEDGDLYKMLYRYIRNIHFVVTETPYKLPDGPDALPLHCWFDLLSL